MKEEKQSFLRDHADTIAIIGTVITVNLAMGAIMIALWVSNSSRVDNAHTRIDTTNNRIDSIHAERKQDSAKHSIGWRPYEDIVPQPRDWMIKDTKQGE